MGARLINNPRRTKIGHVEAFPVLHMRSLRKSAMFSEGQRTEGHFLYPGASNAITIIVDLRSEHDLKVLLEVGHTDSATNMQVIGLTHRPTGFHGRRWYFVSANGERAETLFLVEGFFRTRTEAGLTYRSQSQGELDRALDRRRKLQVQRPKFSRTYTISISKGACRFNPNLVFNSKFNGRPMHRCYFSVGTRVQLGDPISRAAAIHFWQ
jgi:hypothetical protein